MPLLRRVWSPLRIVLQIPPSIQQLLVRRLLQQERVTHWLRAAQLRVLALNRK